LSGSKYVASGSEQSELIEVFSKRNLDIYFDGIYGSPESKSSLVSNIIRGNSRKAVMFGDAISDMNAALDNNIDFIAYLPYSNVGEELLVESKNKGFSIMNSWRINK
jgi:phosphoglycolate phosphatase-like HAD superfamily hydrolase